MRDAGRQCCAPHVPALGRRQAVAAVSVGGVLAVASVIPFAVVLAITGLENGVACLQAYVFTMLYRESSIKKQVMNSETEVLVSSIVENLRDDEQTRKS
jgi:hypothetical protein